MTIPAAASGELIQGRTTDEAGRATRILIVDDEDSLRAILAKYLRGCGYGVETAASGAAALEILDQAAAANDRFALALCDVGMPGMSGLELLRHAVSRDEALAVVMLTGVNDAPTATEALSHGALDYLMKPILLDDLRAATERALNQRSVLIEQRRSASLIREEVAERTADLERERQTLRDLTVGVAESLIYAMETKDPYLRGHSQRVAELSATIAHKMGLDADTVEQVRLAGRLQDVGKIGIRESVLNKPGALTNEEFEHVKGHVQISIEILTPLKHLGEALAYVHDHHEHYDGSGYPRGLTSTAISLGGRILCAADAFDALTSLRAYRDPLEPMAALTLLRASVGSLLDPDVYEALQAVVTRGNALVFLDDVS